MLKTFTNRIAVVVAAVVALTSSATAAERPAHVVLLLDVSTSNPLIVSDEQAARIATDVVRYFPPLGEHSRVTVMLFGEYDARRSTVREIPVSVRFRPEVVRQSVIESIRSLPRLVREGKLKPHNATNLVGALVDAAGRVDCQAENTVIVAATDGQESSADYGTMPPKKQNPIFRGCPELHFVGLNGTSPKHTQALEEAWARWATLAGIAKFTAVR